MYYYAALISTAKNEYLKRSNLFSDLNSLLLSVSIISSIVEHGVKISDCFFESQKPSLFIQKDLKDESHYSFLRLLLVFQQF